MNRFKFRAYITVSYEDDDDNEKEVSFYLYNIIIDEDDVMYINRDFLLDALVNYDDETQDKIEEVLQDNSATGDYENICIEKGFYKNIEQCTGKKDKNGVLIYENDIVKSKQLPEICIVVWSDEEVGFTLKSLKGNSYYSLYCYEDFEIIGNIHENKDLLEANND